MWSYNDAIEDDPYDPEAAKAMLEAALAREEMLKSGRAKMIYDQFMGRIAELTDTEEVEEEIEETEEEVEEGDDK